MKNKRDLWLEVNNIKLDDVKEEMNNALRLRKLADRIEKEDRALWKKQKTKYGKVV